MSRRCIPLTSWLAALLLVTACGSGTARCDGPTPERDAGGPQVIGPEDVGEAATTPTSRLQKPRMLGPIEQRRLEEPGEEAAFREMGALAVPERPAVKGERLTLWDATAPPLRLVVSSWGPDGRPRGELVAPDEGGRVLASFEVPLDVSALAGVLEVRPRTRIPGAGAALVRLEDGALRALEPRLVGGHLVERPLVFLHQDSEAIWLFGRRGDDPKGWFGRVDWQDTDSRVRLERALPFMPNYIRYNQGLDALEVERKLRASSPRAFEQLHQARLRRLEQMSLAERPCGRVRIDASGESRCVVPELERHVAEDAIWLDGPWVSFDADLSGHRPRLGVPSVVNTAGEAAPIRLFESLRSCRYLFRTGLERPPRLLAGCAPPDLGSVLLTLWSPQGVRQLRAPADWAAKIWTRSDDVGGFHALKGWPGRLQEPMLRIAHRDEPVGLWLDLERGTIWQGPQVRPLGPDDSPRRALARRAATPRQPQELVLLDFEEGVIQTVIRDASCAGELEEVGERQGRWALVACRSSAGPTSPRVRTEWAALLDLEEERRWALEGEPLDLLEGGRVVLGKESGGGFDALWVSQAPQ